MIGSLEVQTSPWLVEGQTLMTPRALIVHPMHAFAAAGPRRLYATGALVELLGGRQRDGKRRRSNRRHRDRRREGRALVGRLWRAEREHATYAR